MNIGTTYAKNHIEYIGLNHNNSFEELLNFNFDFVRIGTYWSQMQNQKGAIDFTDIEWMLEKCEKRNQKIILTVGMKAPRYPEFYIPDWANENLDENVLKFIRETLQFVSKYSCITHIQIENEPLDPTWPDEKSIPLELLKKEIDLAGPFNKIIIVNFWANELSKRIIAGPKSLERPQFFFGDLSTGSLIKSTVMMECGIWQDV